MISEEVLTVFKELMAKEAVETAKAWEDLTRELANKLGILPNNGVLVIAREVYDLLPLNFRETYKDNLFGIHGLSKSTLIVAKQAKLPSNIFNKRGILT